MKKYVLIFSLLFIIVSTLKAQKKDSYLKGLPSYFDIKLIKNYEDSLRKQQVDTFITFLTKEKSPSITQNVSDITYFMWIKNDHLNVIKITDTTISLPQKISQHFIKLLKIQNLAITESENDLKFVAPLVVSADGVVFITLKDKNYLVESGDHSSYQPLNKWKEKYRNAFIEAIKMDINPLLNNWIFNRTYNRFDGWGISN